jgi:hypothetical protein
MTGGCLMTQKKTVKRTVSVKKKGHPSQKGPTKELHELLDQLDDKEVAWLVTQAQTMLYNRKVNEVNEAAKKLAESKKRITPVSAPDIVDIVQAGSGKSFNIVMGNARLFLNLDELKALVRIAQATDNAGDASGRMYRWFDRERRDIIIDASLSGPGDPRLIRVYSLLREKFVVD